MPNPNAYPSFSDLMAKIGFVLLQWGFLENAMRQNNREVGDLNQISELTEPRRIRNLIAHGICRASADPSRSGEPFVACLTQGGKEIEIPYSALEQAIAALETYRLRNFR
ncbi:MAG: hypothetical protein QM773_02840 [Hyphomonadaceae bacterium]